MLLCAEIALLEVKAKNNDPIKHKHLGGERNSVHKFDNQFQNSIDANKALCEKPRVNT